MNPNWFHNLFRYFEIETFIELDYGKNYRKALYLRVKTMVSCEFSLKPIHWNIVKHEQTKPPAHSPRPVAERFHVLSASAPTRWGLTAILRDVSKLGVPVVICFSADARTCQSFWSHIPAMVFQCFSKEFVTSCDQTKKGMIGISHPKDSKPPSQNDTHTHTYSWI